VNPAVQPVSPRTMREGYDCSALITNAYIIKKQRGGETAEEDVHKLLDFDGVVMTDSGAYQILIYGNVEVQPEEIIDYQEQISTDIATILDIPTTWKATRDHAERSVKETIRRARQLEKSRTRKDILWVGPVQGGQHLDLVAYSARQMGKSHFQIHALGSPTTVMEQYLFDTLVKMILTAKMNLPLERPFHLFGAGHPFMFALAVALGCDMFDSAAYAIYARQNRYMSEHGTSRIDELEYFPCSCPICSKITPGELRQLSARERQGALAKHNLYSSFAEVRRVKQAIVEGRLWEHVESRVRSHPALLQAAKCLKKHELYIEQHSPVTKDSGLFFFDSLGLARPEIVHYKKSLGERYTPPKKSKILVLLPPPSLRPFHKADDIKRVNKRIKQEFPSESELFHVCVYAAPFGVIPLELDEIYPLSQHEIATPVDFETADYVAERVKDYIARFSYKKAVLVEDEALPFKASSMCKRLKSKGLSISALGIGEKLNDEVLSDLMDALRKLMV